MRKAWSVKDTNSTNSTNSTKTSAMNLRRRFPCPRYSSTFTQKKQNKNECSDTYATAVSTYSSPTCRSDFSLDIITYNQGNGEEEKYYDEQSEGNFSATNSMQSRSNNTYFASCISSIDKSSPPDRRSYADEVRNRKNTAAASTASSDNTTKNTTSTSSKQPKQDKFRDNPEKRNFIKTELCGTFPHVEMCIYGRQNKCNFAHSYDELRLKTMFERSDVGMLDIATYRTRPCFDFIATGDW